MHRHVKVLLGLALVAFAGTVFGAESEPLSMLLKGFQESARSISSKMVAEGGKLLFILGAIQLAWNAVQLLLKGEFGLEAAIGVMLRPMIGLAMWAAFIIMAPKWIPQIIDGWTALGSSVSGARALDPGEIFVLGLDLAVSMSDALKNTLGKDSYLGLLTNPYSAMQIGLLNLILIFTFIILAGQVAMALIKAYLWLAMAPMLMGFGGLRNTQDIALHTLKSAISIGVVILTTYIIIAVGLKMEPTWRALIANVTTETLNSSVWYVIASALLIALAAWQVPKIANDFINGSISGGVSEAAGMAITGAAAGVAAASAGAAMGGAAMSGAQMGSSNLAALANLANSAMGDARDHGKSGMEGVSHAFGSTLEAGGSVFKNALATGYESAQSWASGGSSNTVPGQMASAIESGRGGSIGPGPSFDAGDSSSGSSSSGSGPGGSSSAGGGSAVAGAADTSRSLAASSSSTAPGQGTDVLPSGNNGAGNGPSAATGGSAGAATQPAADDGNPLSFLDWNRTGPDPLIEEMLGPEAAAAAAAGNASGASLSGPAASEPPSPSWSERLSNLSHEIGSTREFLPEGGDGTVSVSASLQGGQDV